MSISCSTCYVSIWALQFNTASAEWTTVDPVINFDTEIVDFLFCHKFTNADAIALQMQSCGRHLPVKTPYLHAKPRSRRGPNSSGDSKRFPLSLSEFLVYVSSRDPEAIEEEIRNGNGPLFHSASTRSNSLHHDERKCSQSLSKEIP